MNAIQAIEEKLNLTKTENGDIAYKSTNSACLDLFSLCGGMRKNTTALLSLFSKAFDEDPIVAIKILFYMRNIRGGLGERNSFRMILKMLAKYSPNVTEQIIPFIPNYGRWDDMLFILNSPVKEKIVSMVRRQIERDIALEESNKNVSLIAKWLPSINASSHKTVNMAKNLAAALNMDAETYRKLCSKLRANLKLLENNLRQRDYTFDYSNQPSQALFRYKKAFIRNDEKRYKAFLDKAIEQAEKIARGEEIPEDERVKLNVKTLYPYQIASPFIKESGFTSSLSKNERTALEASWLAIDRNAFDSKTIVVRDGSYSMYLSQEPGAINIATSLALLFAEQLSGPYKNTFITFSSEPHLIQIPKSAKTLEKKIKFIKKFNDCSNTDIGKVFSLILDVAKDKRIAKEEMLERILIISDMEFDSCSPSKCSFSYWKDKFESEGYKLPEIVFWNVEARNVHLPVTKDESGCILVSGASPSIFTDVVSGDLKAMTPYDFMLKVLEPYKEFDTLKV